MTSEVPHYEEEIAYLKAAVVLISTAQVGFSAKKAGLDYRHPAHSAAGDCHNCKATFERLVNNLKRGIR